MRDRDGPLVLLFCYEFILLLHSCLSAVTCACHTVCECSHLQLMGLCLRRPCRGAFSLRSHLGRAGWAMPAEWYGGGMLL